MRNLAHLAFSIGVAAFGVVDGARTPFVVHLPGAQR
jgi:hypothetical protein